QCARKPGRRAPATALGGEGSRDFPGGLEISHEERHRARGHPPVGRRAFRVLPDRRYGFRTGPISAAGSPRRKRARCTVASSSVLSLAEGGRRRSSSWAGSWLVSSGALVMAHRRACASIAAARSGYRLAIGRTAAASSAISPRWFPFVLAIRSSAISASSTASPASCCARL